MSSASAAVKADSSASTVPIVVSVDAEASAAACVAHLHALLQQYPFVREFIVTTNGCRFIAIEGGGRLSESGETLGEAIAKLNARLGSPEERAAKKRAAAAKLLAEADALVPAPAIQEREGAAA